MTMKPKTKTKMGVGTNPTLPKPKALDARRGGGASAVRKHSQPHARQSSTGAQIKSAQRPSGSSVQAVQHAKPNAASLIFVPRGSNPTNSKSDASKLTAARSIGRPSMANLAATAGPLNKLSEALNPPQRLHLGPSPSARPSSILGSLLLKKSGSPDAFNVYNKKGASGRRRGASKGKTSEKKATSQGREPPKTAQSASSSLARGGAAAPNGMSSIL